MPKMDGEDETGLPVSRKTVTIEEIKGGNGGKRRKDVDSLRRNTRQGNIHEPPDFNPAV
jgi:hypothetical protein